MESDILSLTHSHIREPKMSVYVYVEPRAYLFSVYVTPRVLLPTWVKNDQWRDDGRKVLEQKCFVAATIDGGFCAPGYLFAAVYFPIHKLLMKMPMERQMIDRSC